MFDWFITKYGKTTTEDREENRQRMADDWHPADGFEPLATRLFIGASYASAACFPMDDLDVIDIGIRVIKRCGMYSEEYKNWIACENETPPIVETIGSFKEYWADAIALVNQTAAPASQHGYGMAAMDDDVSITSYSESLANFGAAYAATQESMKAQATTMVAMQGQLTNIQQFCMAVNQQPPPNIYAPSLQQPTFNNRPNRRNSGGHGNGSTGGSNSGGGGNFPQQPTWFGCNGAGAQLPTRPPTPYKRWENWNYCHTHGGDVDDTHMSASCGNRGPTHNANATRAKIHGWIDRRNAQDHPSLSMRPYSSPPSLPPAAAASTATPTSGILPWPGHDATYVQCTHDHAHTGASARPRHDEFCRTAISSTKCRERADDAAASSTGDAHDGTLLCSQPLTLLCPQPAAAGILLTSRGGQ